MSPGRGSKDGLAMKEDSFRAAREEAEQKLPSKTDDRMELYPRTAG